MTFYFINNLFILFMFHYFILFHFFFIFKLFHCKPRRRNLTVLSSLQFEWDIVQSLIAVLEKDKNIIDIIIHES